MSSLSYISSLPPELLYTILSHALADILFDYLFVGALLLDVDQLHRRHPDGMDEISSLGGVSVAWRATLHRILTALLHLHRPNQDEDNVQSLPTKQMQMHRAHHHQLTTTARAHPTPISQSAASASTITITINSNSNAASSTTTSDVASLQSYQRTLHTMQIALRDLVQHSIDTYRNEQDLDANHQTGVTTPTLLHPPPPAGAGIGIGIGIGIGTPPLVPHSIPPHSIPPAPVPAAPVPALNQHPSVSNQNAPAQQPNFLPPVNNHHHHLFGALLLRVAAAGHPTLKEEYATIPLFQHALCYSQAAVFTCQSSSSSSPRLRPSGRWNIYENITVNASASANSANANGANGGVRVQRQDLSTLVLTTSRLVAALEWVGGGRYNRSSLRDNTSRICASSQVVRICPREVCEVVECGMGEVRERIEDAIRVCRWNDLLHAVFLRGERSDEMLEALDGCFDDLEANATSIQMHHLLRSNLFKTVQTIARLGPISLGVNTPLQPNPTTTSSTPSPPSSSQSQSSQFGFDTPGRLGSNTPPQLSSCNGSNGSSGEIWRSRAGALAFRWMGRVVEWTGL